MPEIPVTQERKWRGMIGATAGLRAFVIQGLAITGAVLLCVYLANLAIEKLADFIPFSIEHSLSREYERTLPEAGKIDRYLQSLTDRIVAVQELPNDMRIKAHYIDAAEVNAFSTVGGHIFVYRGLLEKLPHENALVMLLAHEVAHIKFRHPLKGMGKGIAASLMLSMLFGTSNNDSLIDVINDAGSLTTLNYNQYQELVADEEALAVYIKLYQTTEGANALYNILGSSPDRVGSLHRFIPSGYRSNPPRWK